MSDDAEKKEAKEFIDELLTGKKGVHIADSLQRIATALEKIAETTNYRPWPP